MLYDVCNLDLREEPVQNTTLLYLRVTYGSIAMQNGGYGLESPMAVSSEVHSKER
jgi:hypothetical protein